MVIGFDLGGSLADLPWLQEFARHAEKRGDQIHIATCISRGAEGWTRQVVNGLGLKTYKMHIHFKTDDLGQVKSLTERGRERADILAGLQVDLAFDDHPEIVDEIRKRGILAIQCK